RLGDLVGILQHGLVVVRGADGGDDALADAGDDGLLRGAADELAEIGAHGDAGLDLELDAVLGDGVDGGAGAALVGAVDDLRVHRGLHGVENVASGEINGGGGAPVDGDVRAAGG